MGITDLQQARSIIKSVGGKHQHRVIEELRSLTYNHAQLDYEKDAQKVIRNMEKEYALNVANVLWIDKYDEIPDYLKN